MMYSSCIQDMFKRGSPVELTGHRHNYVSIMMAPARLLVRYLTIISFFQFFAIDSLHSQFLVTQYCNDDQRYQ
jgi:hypothetical protein